MAMINLHIEAGDAADLANTLRQLVAGFAATAPTYAPKIGAGVGGTVVATQAGNTDAPQGGSVPDIPTAQELSTSAIVAFIDSDPRYKMRSFTAICDHFTSRSSFDIQEALEEAVNDGDIERLKRSADGEDLYKVVI